MYTMTKEDATKIITDLKDTPILHTWEDINKALHMAISALSEPKIGKWVHHDGGYSDHYECTACGTPIVLTERWKFCPNCGADMRDEEE